VPDGNSAAVAASDAGALWETAATSAALRPRLTDPGVTPAGPPSDVWGGPVLLSQAYATAGGSGLRSPVAGAAGAADPIGQGLREALAAPTAPAGTSGAPATGTPSGQALLHQFNTLHPVLAGALPGPRHGPAGLDNPSLPPGGPPEFIGPDCAQGVAVGRDNIAYVVGWMTDPVGSTSAFVARVDPQCDILCVNIIPNLFGLPGPDCAYGVATGPDNNAYVVGCMANPAGATSAFVARVDPNCNLLCDYVTYPNPIGLTGPDCAYGVSVGPDNLAYVVGCYTNPAGSTSAFVTRFDPNCNLLCGSTLFNPFGLTGPDCAYGVSVGPDNFAYVVGCFANPAGATSAFVARVDPLCNIPCVNLIPNLFGLPGPDCAYGVAAGPDNNAYVVGCLANPAGATSAFVARVDPGCNLLCDSVLSNPFGLAGPDCAYGVSAGPDNFAYVVGCFANPAGATSAFVARADPLCNIPCFNLIPNLFGLPGPDCAHGVAVGPDNFAYDVGCLANPFGFTSAFVSRTDPVCNIPCVNEIPNVFGV
jgi:hypothetical protein